MPAASTTTPSLSRLKFSIFEAPSSLEMHVRDGNGQDRYTLGDALGVKHILGRCQKACQRANRTLPVAPCVPSARLEKPHRTRQPSPGVLTIRI